MSQIFEDASNLAFVYVTFPDRNAALAIGRAAVEQRLAACANVFAPHESIYHWKGNVETASECAAIFKTIDGKTDELGEFVRSKHPYETPCIAVLTPSQINTAFGDWIRLETGSNRVD